MTMTSLEQAKKARIALASAQQRQASDPAKSVWVEASAGTGKTKVLSDRVLRLLMNGVAPERILCLTYTKAAAVEMSNRIAMRLSQWAVISDEDLQKQLESLLGAPLTDFKKPQAIMAQARKLFAQLLDTAGGMKIQTIHSFCQEILKRFPLEAHISPYFEVMDDRSAQEAMDDVKRKLLTKIETDPQSRAAEALGFITQNVSEFSFPKLISSLAVNRNKIWRIITNYGSVAKLLDETAKRLNVKADETLENALSKFWAELPRKELRDMVAAWNKGSKTDQQKAEVLARILETTGNDAAYELYRSLFFTGNGEPRKSFATKGAIAANPLILETAQSECLRLDEFENHRAALRLFASTRAVLYLADDLISGYYDYKKLHSKMDYEDLIVLTRNLLENPQVADWVLYKLDGGIDNVLIDEAQDTSPDQWAIIRSITNEFFNGEGAKDKNCTVFAVGDRKQSIYSFQGADPQEFERMRKHFATHLQAEGNFKEVNLEVSFRSTAAILDTVNCVFEDECAKQGVVPSNQDVVHIPSRIGEGGKVELWPLIEAEKDENPDVWYPPVERNIPESTSSRLARQIALRIKQMVAGKEKLVSQNRPLHYRDFMVLVQQRDAFVEEFVRACKNCGVMVSGVDKISLLEQIAVQDLVSLGKFLLLPTDDLTLAEVLKSPLFGLEDKDIFVLCYKRGAASLWSRLGDNHTYREVYQTLQELLNMADFVRPFELYAYVLNKLQGRKRFITRLGYEAEDGIDEFMNLCLNFEQEHIPTLQLFVDWIAKDEVKIKRELEQSELDAVRIMTVHGSKGLQAPIVILPDMVRIKQVKKESGLLLDDVLYYPLSSKDYESKTNALKQKEKQATLEEYRRLLYVALTRAEERLCLCGYRKSTKPNEDSWYEICRRSLEKIADKDSNGGLVYEVAQTQEVVEKDDAVPVKETLYEPEWLTQNAPEEGALSKPLTPSKADEEDVVMSPLTATSEGRFRRGKIIHKLLQFIPQCAADSREKIIRNFLAVNAADLPTEENERIVQEVLRLFSQEQFGFLFAENSKAEVPIMGIVGDKLISGQIDRLAVDEKTVKIVDYKTNRPAASSVEQIPQLYRKQLQAYKSLVEKIYPHKKVETYILWTDTAKLMQLD